MKKKICQTKSKVEIQSSTRAITLKKKMFEETYRLILITYSSSIYN